MKMNNNQLTRIAALALSCVASIANADGYLVNETPELWSGPYVGAYLGGGAGSMDTTYNRQINDSSFKENHATPPVISLNTISNTTLSGSMGGNATGSVADLFMGYNYHKSNSQFLVGAQLEGTVFSDITMKAGASLNQVATESDLIANLITITQSSPMTEARYNLSSMFSVIGRAGYLAKPNTLVYGLVGPTEGNFVIPDVREQSGGDKSQWQLGVTAGAGLEHKFNEHWSILAEYRYMHFNPDSNTYTSSPGVKITPNANPANVTTNTTTLVTATTWSSRFGMNVGNIGIVYRI